MTNEKENRQEKYFVLGAKGAPIPAFSLDAEFGVYASNENFFKLATLKDASQNELYGEFLRNIPTRSFIKITNELLADFNINNSKRALTSGLLGAPGSGKTFFYETLGKLVHPQGAILVDCSNEDLKNLLVETIFDTKTAIRERAAIDARLQAYNRKDSQNAISEAGLSSLKSLLKENLIEKDGKYYIDWHKTAKYGYEAQTFREELRLICKAEGIDLTADAGSIGIIEQNGPLFRSLDPASKDYGRPVILDELNRSKIGTVENLYGLINFLNSEKQTFLMEGAHGNTLLIDKRTMPRTWFLCFTGNQNLRGMGSDSLNKPFLSRLAGSIKTVPDLTAQDYADMISSRLFGVSGTIIRDAFGYNEEELPQVIRMFRKIGEPEKIPEEQLQNIQNAKNLCLMADQLGEFIYGVKNLATGHSRAFDEIERKEDINTVYRDYLSDFSFDWRLVNAWFRKASHLSLESVTELRPTHIGLSEDERDEYVALTHQEDEITFTTRGYQLENVIVKWLEDVFIPKDMDIRGINKNAASAMLQAGFELAKQWGIISPDLKEAQENIPLIRDLYSIEMTKDKEQDLIRKIIVSEIKKHNPELKDINDEMIVSKTALDASLIEARDMLSSQRKAKKAEAQAKMIIPNTLHNNDIFMPAYLMMRKDASSIDISSLVSLEAFVLSRVLLEKQKDLNVIFSEENNKDNNPIMKEVFVVEYMNTPRLVFIFKNKENGKEVIIGDTISADLQGILKAKNIDFIQKDSFNAKKEISVAIGKLYFRNSGHNAPSDVSAYEDDLLWHFRTMYKENSNGFSLEESSDDLAQMLVSAQVDWFNNLNYIVNELPTANKVKQNSVNFTTDKEALAKQQPEDADKKRGLFNRFKERDRS